jgi:hypothetical protein
MTTFFEVQLRKAGQNLVNNMGLSDAQFDYFYEYYSNNGQMPYGVAKARTGDPYDWVDAQITKEYEMLTK